MTNDKETAIRLRQVVRSHFSQQEAALGTASPLDDAQRLSDVWAIYDGHQAAGRILQASYFLFGAARAMGTTMWQLLEDRFGGADDTTNTTNDTPALPERDPRIDGPLGDAYARYDGDDRVNGPDDFSAFADAVEALAPFILRDAFERFISFLVLEEPS